MYRRDPHIRESLSQLNARWPSLLTVVATEGRERPKGFFERLVTPQAALPAGGETAKAPRAAAQGSDGSATPPAPRPTATPRTVPTGGRGPVGPPPSPITVGQQAAAEAVQAMEWIETTGRSVAEAVDAASTSSGSTRTTPRSSSSPSRNRDCSVSGGARRASALGFVRRARGRSAPSGTARVRRGAAVRVRERAGREPRRGGSGGPGRLLAPNAPAGRSPRAVRPWRTRETRNSPTRRSWPRTRPGRSGHAADAAGVVEGTGAADPPHGRKVWLRRKR